jgi:thiamine pyrophosphokinase
MDASYPMPKTAYLFLNGGFTRPSLLPDDPGDALVMAADGGAIHPLALGWPIHVLLGDFDSIDRKTLKELKRRKGIKVVSFPAEKDQTDFELALLAAILEVGEFGEIRVLGALGGKRPDMAIANLLLPAAFLPTLGKRRPRIIFQEGDCVIHILEGNDQVALTAAEGGSLVSLVPLGSVCREVTLKGDFKYPLDGAILYLGLTLGVSNELRGGVGEVIMEEGTLAVFIQPLETADKKNRGDTVLMAGDFTKA